jgi:hypothetical protein
VESFFFSSGDQDKEGMNIYCEPRFNPDGWEVLILNPDGNDITSSASLPA